MDDSFEPDTDLAIPAAGIHFLQAHEVVSNQAIRAESCPDGVFGKDDVDG